MAADDTFEDTPWIGVVAESSNGMSCLNVMNESSSPTWIIDSGATHHITPDRSLLSRSTILADPLTFGLADHQSSMEAIEVGDVDLKLSSVRRMILKDVYYVPTSRVTSFPCQGCWRQDGRRA